VAVKRSETTSATEDYLKAIYSLAEESDHVIAARVAEDIGVTPSTMFSALRRLEKEEFVRVERRKNIYLTTKGREVAEAILRRHYLTERLLTDLLGLDWVTAHQEAHHLEHAISPVVEERLSAILDNPSTCPHGNPIPVQGQPSPRREWNPLNTVESGTEVVFRCITETGERDARLLSFLYDHMIRPGSTIDVVEVAPSLGTVSLKVGDAEVVLGLEAAKKIYVQ
jgi:DtxR family Mn-dependent transcriptional regulator